MPVSAGCTEYGVYDSGYYYGYPNYGPYYDPYYGDYGYYGPSVVYSYGYYSRPHYRPRYYRYRSRHTQRSRTGHVYRHRSTADVQVPTGTSRATRHWRSATGSRPRTRSSSGTVSGRRWQPPSGQTTTDTSTARRRWLWRHRDRR